MNRRTLQALNTGAIATAEEFLEYTGVEYEAHPYNGYEYLFDPLCHSSTGGRSGQVGTGRFGLMLNCWSCGMGEAVRRTRLEVDRRLWIDYNSTESTASGALRALRPMQPTYMGEWLTVSDLMMMRTWIAVEGKKGAMMHGVGQFKQSVKGEEHPIHAARYGEPGWWTVADLQDEGYDVWGLCFGADESVDSVTDVAVIDLDYNPDSDDTMDGAIRKQQFIDAMSNNGHPVFKSSSGNGAHILFRVDMEDDWLAKKTMQKHGDGIGTEIFTPGCRYFTAVRLERPYNTTLEDEIPIRKKVEILSEIATYLDAGDVKLKNAAESR